MIEVEPHVSVEVLAWGGSGRAIVLLAGSWMPSYLVINRAGHHR
jgi:hypothetical protein